MFRFFILIFVFTTIRKRKPICDKQKKFSKTGAKSKYLAKKFFFPRILPSLDIGFWGVYVCSLSNYIPYILHNTTSSLTKLYYAFYFQDYFWCAHKHMNNLPRPSNSSNSYLEFNVIR